MHLQFRALHGLALLALLALLAPLAAARGLYDHQVYDISGEAINLNRFSGRYSLVVNIHPTDPHWTTQLAWMAKETLKHKNFGFEMFAVPADEFPSGGHNSPPLHNGDVQHSIEEALGNDHGMHLLAKSRVNGKCPASDVTDAVACGTDSTHCCAANNQFYEAIRHQPRGVPKVQTNFAKFLIDPKGKLLARFEGREPLRVRAAPLRDT
jgi:glutathione peroxidase-family protein